MNTNAQIIDNDIKFTVFGYTRNIEYNREYFYTIPIVLINIILWYYYDNFIFDEEKNNANNIKIINNGKIMKKIKYDGRASNIIFGDEISYENCNKFNISIKWKKCIYGYFYFGFITSTINESIKCWNWNLGEGQNKENTVGILVDKYEKNFYLSDKNNHYKQLKEYTSKKNFSQGDIFGLKFDFINNKISIYHNNVYTTNISLNNIKKIIIAFTLSAHKDEQLEVIKCSLS